MNLHRRIAAIIITRLELEGYAPENFPLATPLFGPKPGGFGLDSLAGLEIMSGLSDEFGEPFDDVQRADLESVAALAAYVRRKAPNALAAAKGHE
jgi:acyl carrier protein